MTSNAAAVTGENGARDAETNSADRAGEHASSETRVGDVCEALVEYLRAQHGDTCPDDLDAQSPLLELGIIDSLSMMAFILFLEERFELDFLEIDISRDDFQNVRMLADVVIENLEVPEPGKRGCAMPTWTVDRSDLRSQDGD